MSFLLPQRSVAVVAPLWQALAHGDRPEQSHGLRATQRSASADRPVRRRIQSSSKELWTRRMTLVIVLMMRRRMTMALQEATSSKTTARSGRVGPYVSSPL